MNRSQLENLYKVNGLTDYKLNTADDLLRVHGIDYKAVNGYSGLDDLNRAIYAKFIINFFNAQGLGMVLMKTEIVRVRLTELEKALLQERAEKLKMTMSDYVKYCCLVNPPVEITKEGN